MENNKTTKNNKINKNEKKTLENIIKTQLSGVMINILLFTLMK